MISIKINEEGLIVALSTDTGKFEDIAPSFINESNYDQYQKDLATNEWLFMPATILYIVEDISNCPQDTTVTRKAELKKLSTDLDDNVASMTWRIKHYRNGVHIPVEIPDIDLTFQATMDIQREYPAGSGLFKSEYEIMIDLQNQGYKVWEIAISELHYNDSKGLLNERCNYGH